MRRFTLGAVAPILLALVAAGCGSSSSSSSSSGTSTAGAAAPAGTSSTASSSSAAEPAALLTTKHTGKLGTVLAFGNKKLTVYLFEADKGGSSHCTGACTRFWPPVTGRPKALGGAASADLGTITRPDGGKQVTYKGHPLYLFVKDKDDGDAYGEGVKAFGADWYAVSASGKKVDLS